MKAKVSALILALYVLAGCSKSANRTSMDASVDASIRSDSGASTDATVACPERDSSGAFFRINQVGYGTSDPKHLRLMSKVALTTGATFHVTDSSCATVLAANIGNDLGSLNTTYSHVYDIDVSSITRADAYNISLDANGVFASATFRVGDAHALYQPLLANAIRYYEASRDGADVNASILSRRPSHLADEMAHIYAEPSYDNDVLQGSLVAHGNSTVDVSGGWFDAGDYLKFVQTTSYVEAVMLIAVRDHAAQLGDAGATEATFGLDWLAKMFRDDTGTLLYQVGIGDGNGASIEGDHDSWRLPEVDDTLGTSIGDANYYVQNRPVFQANSAEGAISPNLAGRLAAVFGLCAQVYGAADVTRATACLRAGEHVFTLANLSPGTLLTASPFDYYGETEWRDDLELGAAELALAIAQHPSLAVGLPETSAANYLATSANWANEYLNAARVDGVTDTLNLYDVGALAHRELARAMDMITASSLATTRTALTDDLRAQLEAGKTFCATPFSIFDPKHGDSVPHSLGLAMTAKFYEELTSDPTYAQFGASQRDAVLGANAWGTSFVVGAGELFPHCLHHQIANLAGALDGTSPLLLGAVVDGPADPSEFADLTTPDGARACASTSEPWPTFDSAAAAFRDDVAAWPSVEPSLDYTALTLLIFATP